MICVLVKRRSRTYLLPAISLAKLSGFSPIITTASLKNASFLQGLGATHVLDRNLPTESLAAEIAKITNEPIQYIYDAVSLKPTEQSGLDLLAPGGKLAVVQTPEVTTPPGKSIIRIMGILQDHNSDLLKDLYHKKVADFLEQGVIKVSRQTRLFFCGEEILMKSPSPIEWKLSREV